MSLHSTIKRFGLEGQLADDTYFMRVHTQYTPAVIAQMREDGYVPVLDFGPFFSTTYIAETGRYDFVLSVYGVYVGRKKAKTTEGVDGLGRWYERNNGNVHGEAD